MADDRHDAIAVPRSRRWLSPALGVCLLMIAAFAYASPQVNPADSDQERAAAQRSAYSAVRDRAAASNGSTTDAPSKGTNTPRARESRPDNAYTRATGSTSATDRVGAGEATRSPNTRTAPSNATRAPQPLPAADRRVDAPTATPGGDTPTQPAGDPSFPSTPEPQVPSTTTPALPSTTAPAPPSTTTPAPTPTSCAGFRWQQDAQAAYVSNLNDPFGLDGAPGPNDDDGIACSLLPTDPDRPASLPVGAGRAPTCADFSFQQDAQAVYVRNLNDPFGLDGAPGPNDDDGIACSLLAADPTRPPSEPAGAKPPAPKPPPQFVVPSLDDIRATTATFVGVSTPQAPFDWKEYQIFTAAAGGKAPNVVEFFQGWDLGYPAAAVEATWRRGALPMISWEPRDTVQAQGPDAANNTSAGVQLAAIIRGDFDTYIDQWAVDAKAQGLPIAIRWAHEMNGNWFPWSEERNGNRKGEYALAWRHIVDRFRAAGADNVLWVWSPNVITARPSVDIATLYPGDDYVDWNGIVGYYRYVIAGKAATFDNTYGSTLAKLRSFTAKPIFLTEIGATEVGGNKVAWIQSLFQSLPNNPDVIGFVWFDHSVNGNDWRIESSAAASQAFAAGVADDRYGRVFQTVF